MKGFTLKESQELIDEALRAKSAGESLTEVFERIAVKTRRAKGSVRNYYYNLVKTAQRDNEIAEKYAGIEKIKVEKSQNFTKEDEQFLEKAIKEGREKGKSVRRVIIELSGGDDKLALRYQNKYRNILKKQNVEKLPIPKEDFKYFEKLSKEIDGLVERIRGKYALECAKLKEENENLSREISMLKGLKESRAVDFFIESKKV